MHHSQELSTDRKCYFCSTLCSYRHAILFYITGPVSTPYDLTYIDLIETFDEVVKFSQELDEIAPHPILSLPERDSSLCPAYPRCVHSPPFSHVVAAWIIRSTLTVSAVRVFQ